MDDDEDDAANRGSAVPLIWWERTASALIGLTAMVAGAVAAFQNRGSTGTGVLIVIGAVFTLMAIVGMPIISANFGGAGISLQQRAGGRMMRRLATADQNDPLARATAMFVAESVDAKAVAGLPTIVGAAQYQRDVAEALDRIGGVRATSTFASQTDPGYDLVVALPNEKRVAVETRFSKSAQPLSMSRQSAAQLASVINNDSDLQAGFLVTNEPLTRPAADVLSSSPELDHVVWRGPKDDANLRAALEPHLTIHRVGGSATS